MRVWVVLLALGIGALVWRHRANSAPSFETALKGARQARQPLVLEFTMTGCAACRAFDDLILADPAVQAALKPVRFVKYNVTEEPPGQAAAERFDVRGYPTVIVVGDDGRARTRWEGAFQAGPVGVARFAAFLRNAASAPAP
jgi:thiol:disulfide interchange protein